MGTCTPQLVTEREISDLSHFAKIQVSWQSSALGKNSTCLLQFVLQSGQRKTKKPERLNIKYPHLLFNLSSPLLAPCLCAFSFSDEAAYRLDKCLSVAS